MTRYRLLVENLSHEVTNRHIAFVFSQYGGVNAVKYSRLRHKAIIEMSSRRDANNAFMGLNGTSLWGNTMKISVIDTEIKLKLSSIRKLITLI